MREIKFRAWDKKRKKMIYDDVVVTNNTVTVYFGSSGNGAWLVNGNPDYIPMQYIGLKDKNGKEIYEGDILDMDGLCFVIWKEGAYWVESPGSNAQDLPSSQDFVKSTILGNIHENSINDYWKTNEN